jgi:alkaline phosphatase D
VIARREVIGTLLAGSVGWCKPDAGSTQATGIKIGEVTSESAVIWTRRTAKAGRLTDGIVRRGGGKNAIPPEPGADPNVFEGACPGGNGYVRLVVEPVSSRGRKRTFGWEEVNPADDFVRQFRVDGLDPAAGYRFSVETREARGKREDSPLTGEFRTAPIATADVPIYFALTSCQKYSETDRPDGLR